jgi:hypothetical protein
LGTGAPSPSGSRIEQRSLSDRPTLSVIERQGDPEAAIGFASLAHDSPVVHAELGELLSARLTRAGFHSQLIVHGLGFELTLLAERPERARAAATALLQALQAPVAAPELAALPAAPEQDRTAAGAVALCSGELTARRRLVEVTPLERERVAAFAQDRAALSVVGDAAVADAVADVLEAGPDWPELGRVRSTLPEKSQVEVLRGPRPTLSVALTVTDPNRALSAAALLGEPKAALATRLSALGDGLRLRRVTATAHPQGACLRIDSEVDASPVPEPRRLGFAIQLIEEEASLALAKSEPENRLESSALSASDPRSAARAVAYHALLEPMSKPAGARLVALTTPDEGPLTPSIETAIEQARQPPPLLDTQVRFEGGQPGAWALLSTPCAAMTERAETAGHAALLLAAASAGATRDVRLEPWVGSSGVGLLGFAEQRAGESDAQVATRLADALGQALLAPPAVLDLANARSELIRAAGSDPHPLLDALLEALAPGRVGALAPRGNVTSLQLATREAALARQRELLRLPHRLAVLAPNKSFDVTRLRERLSRWLHGPDASRPSPCTNEVSPPARGELSLPPGRGSTEGSYVAFRIPAKAGAEASVLAEVLNLPGGALARALAEPDLVGAARALVFGTTSARSLVVQISAFAGREAEAISRVQKLFERIAAGGALTSAELEAATAQRRSQHRLAALDPRYRVVQLLEPAAPVVEAAALRRLASSLRPDSAIIARGAPAPVVVPSPGKAAPSR